MTIIVLVALLISIYQYFYMKEVFTKGKLTLPFLHNVETTIEQYSDSQLQQHQIMLQLLRRAIIPKITGFIEWERKFTHTNKIILILNVWILVGIILGTIQSGVVYYFTIGLLSTIIFDLLMQQFKLVHAKYYMKRACSNYTKYMEQRETSKAVINDFLHSVDTLIDSIPLNNKNNKDEEKPDGRSN